MILPITLTIAAAAALLNIWIGWRVGQVRMRSKILIGDGGNAALVGRMRAHSNYVEYTPFFLILLALIEHGIGSPMWLWAVSILYIIARILHAFGMDRNKVNGLRAAGIIITYLVTIGLAGFAIYLAYQSPSMRRPEAAPPGSTLSHPVSAHPAPAGQS